VQVSTAGALVPLAFTNFKANLADEHGDDSNGKQGGGR
jgi:hypothetical protein